MLRCWPRDPRQSDRLYGPWFLVPLIALIASNLVPVNSEPAVWASGAPGSPPVLRADTFARANSASGWGIASDGHTWALLSGASAAGGTVRITGNKGILAQSSASLFNVLGSSVSSAGQEGLVRWSVDSTNATAGILLRAQNASNYYLARYNGQGSIEFMKKVGGVSTHYTAFSFTPGGGNLYWLRFQVQGTTISIKVWAAGTPEPDLWTYTTTDTSITAAGSVGLYGFAINDTPNTFDNFTVRTPTSSEPAAVATSTPVPTQDTEAVAGPARLTQTQSDAGVTVQSLNASNDGWRVFFNSNQGGAITSLGEIDGGVYTELMQQAVPHAHMQSYVNVNGTLVSNQQPGAHITVLRSSPALVALRTISTNPIYGLTWTYYYYIWPDGKMFVQLNVQNIGATALTLGGTRPLEINHDGLVLAGYASQAPYEWYGLKSSITSPVPSSVVSVEPDFFARTPSIAPGPTLGSFMDKLTPWSAVGASSYGTRDFSGGTNGRAKEQWFGSMSSLAAGKALTFSILLDLRRSLTQDQSVDIDADYRSPGVTAGAGSVNSSDTEPVSMPLVNGFNVATGTYVLSAGADHVTCLLSFPPGVRTRWSPAYKILGWSKGAPTVRWGGQVLSPGSDFAYTLDEATQTLYLQLDFDVVAQDPLPGQRLNDYLDVS